MPDDQLSLAIGRQGQNVRLASKLMSWRIDVKSEQRYSNLENPGYQTLTAIDGVDESMADRFFAAEILSAAMLAEMEPSDIAAAGRIGEEQAEGIKTLAAEIPPVELENEQPAAEIDQVSEGEDVQVSESEPEPVDAAVEVAGSAAEDDEQPDDSAQEDSEMEEKLPTTGDGDSES